MITDAQILAAITEKTREERHSFVSKLKAEMCLTCCGEFSHWDCDCRKEYPEAPSDY